MPVTGGGTNINTNNTPSSMEQLPPPPPRQCGGVPQSVLSTHTAGGESSLFQRQVTLPTSNRHGTTGNGGGAFQTLKVRYKNDGSPPSLDYSLTSSVYKTAENSLNNVTADSETLLANWKREKQQAKDNSDSSLLLGGPFFSTTNAAPAPVKPAFGLGTSFGSSPSPFGAPASTTPFSSNVTPGPVQQANWLI